jgi:hypothetical protein
MAAWRPRTIIVLCFWLLMPLGAWNQIDLVRDHPDQLYSPPGDPTGVKPLFSQRSCELTPPDEPCHVYETAYVSTPLFLPFVYLFGGLIPPRASLFALRLLAAAALVGGMWVLWQRFAPISAAAPKYFFWSTVVLTPMAYLPIRLGQVGPLMFLSAALGISRSGRARGLLLGPLWILNVVAKLFPVVLVVLLVIHRRWRLLAAAAVALALLAAGSLLLGPTSLWTTFVDSSRELARVAPDIRYSGSVDSLIDVISPSVAAAPVTQAVVRIALLVGLGWLVLRITDIDSQWAFGYLAAVPLASIVWWHYLWLAIPAVTIVLAARPRSDRELLALPIFAAGAALISIPIGQGNGIPLLQLAGLIGAIVATYLLARPARSGAASRMPA